jgi:hypothetical protein
MSELKFNNLQPSGSQLFADPESFLDDLSADEIEVVHGAGHRYRTIPRTAPDTIFYQPTGTYATVPGGNSGINCTNFYTGGTPTIPVQTTVYKTPPIYKTPPMMTPPVPAPPMTTKADFNNG